MSTGNQCYGDLKMQLLYYTFKLKNGKRKKSVRFGKNMCRNKFTFKMVMNDIRKMIRKYVRVC